MGSYSDSLWDDVVSQVFDELGYLLDESAIRIEYRCDFTGPGGDWDDFSVTIEGCDSGKSCRLAGKMNDYSNNYEQLAEDLAAYIAESQDGELEDEGNSWLITF